MPENEPQRQYLADDDAVADCDLAVVAHGLASDTVGVAGFLDLVEIKPTGGRKTIGQALIAVRRANSATSPAI
jgi:hypothetical protein